MSLAFLMAALTGSCTHMHPAAVSPGTVRLNSSITGTDSETSTAYLYLASRRAISAGEYDTAAAILEKALKKDPDSFILTRDLASLYLQQKRDSKALELTEKLVELQPDNVDALLLLIQLKKDSLDENTLVKMLNRILVLDPDNKESFLRLGKIYHENESSDSALALFEKMADQFPDDYVAWYYLGQASLNNQDYARAEACFLKTIELEPALVEPRFQLIRIYQERPEKDQSSTISDRYTEILEMDPGNRRAQLGLALHLHKTRQKQAAAVIFEELSAAVDTDSKIIMVAFDEYISTKKYADARVIFSQMLKTDPENSTLNFFSGMVYEAMGNYDAAIAHYLKITPDHEQYQKSILTIAYLYKELDRNHDAIAFLQARHRIHPDDTDIMSYLASFYEDDDQHEAAIALLEKALALAPNDTGLLFKLGAIQDTAGFQEKGLDTMRKILELDPEDASALNYLGYSYADMEIRLDEAFDLIEKAYQIRPDDGYITDSMGWIHYKLGNYEKAVFFLEKAAELTEFETIIADHLGDAYLKADRPDDALRVFKLALENSTEEDQDLVPNIRKKIEQLEKD